MGVQKFSHLSRITQLTISSPGMKSKQWIYALKFSNLGYLLTGELGVIKVVRKLVLQREKPLNSALCQLSWPTRFFIVRNSGF